MLQGVRACSASRSPVVHSNASYRASEETAVTTPAKSVPATETATTRSDEVIAKHKQFLWPSVTN